MEKTLLALEHLDAGYKDLQVLFDVSLYVDQGEVVALLGQNGAGKSTVLKAVLGLLGKKTGRIVHAPRISYVPQGKRVFPNLTVLENVIVRGATKGIPEDLERLFPILRTKKDMLAKALSGGEQQMVALARALIDRPDVLLLDEPSLGLSPKLVRDVFGLIDRIRRERKIAVLVVEHNLTSLLRIADRGYVLERGRIVGELTADDFGSKESVYGAIMGAGRTGQVGYDKETAERYTAGEDAYFMEGKVKDEATIEMRKEVSRLSELAPPRIVVDMGCGSNADYLKGWQKASGAETIVGVEPSSHMRSLLRERVRPPLSDVLRIAEGNWSHTDIETGSIDMVVSRLSLHNMKEIGGAYRELSRILRPGAHAVIAVPHPENCRRILEEAHQEVVEGAPMEVGVFGTTLRYYYHDIDSYLGTDLAANGLALVTSRSFAWGAKDNVRPGIPNTLLFTLKKMAP